ncbi:MAG: spermidine synthase [Candidatus Brocadia carolinensis]|uniref:Polyamine aminopropyltransferase n=1 Tax=Candidatus Brocadia carolinensis TaxID=1004156 RepID=A0A1V4AXW6_9BACT|nr:MAG: spermidine synthase [Candidatus Brocadia caroliniensis]
MEKNQIHWIDDYFNNYELHKHAFKDVVCQVQSEIQKIIIVNTYNYGRCLILDNEFQSAEMDEFIYHEALVQPSLILHPGAESVLILGGGEGATLREVLRHKTVKKAVMVDIDKEMIACSKKFLPSFHAGAFDDSRVELVIEEGRKYVERAQDRFDVVVIDVNDPLDGGPSYMLFTMEFFQIIAEKLKANGILIVQSGAASVSENDAFTSICNTLSNVFSHVFPYVTYIPSYALPWGFSMATHNPSNLDISGDEIDTRIQSRLTGKLRFYDSITHHALFNLSKYLRTDIQRQKRILRDKAPLKEHYPGISTESENH